MRIIYNAHVIVKRGTTFIIENDITATEYSTVDAAMDYIDAKIRLLRAGRQHGVVS